MAVIVIGINHKTAPVAVREELSFSGDARTAALDGLRKECGLSEAVLLSTCNRTEVYAVTPADGPDQAVAAVSDFFARDRSFPPEDLEQYLYIHREEDAMRHLLMVAGSLDSMVVGEVQILGQVKEAYSLAQEHGATGAVLNGLFQRAMKVAKRVRTETEIGRMPVSIASVAVDLAKTIFGELAEQTVMILGAGEMAESTARHLVDNGARTVFVANRTYSKAEELASRFKGEAVQFEKFPEYLEQSDIVIGSTNAPHYVVSRKEVTGLMHLRRHRPMFFIDISVPRNIDPDVNRVDNVYLYNIDDLQGVADSNLEARGRTVEEARAIVDQGMQGVSAWYSALGITPTITALQAKLEGLGRQELDKVLTKLEGATDEDRERITFLVNSLVKKILGDPCARLRQEARSGNAFGYTRMLHRLFNLDDPDDLQG